MINPKVLDVSLKILAVVVIAIASGAASIYISEKYKEEKENEIIENLENEALELTETIELKNNEIKDLKVNLEKSNKESKIKTIELKGINERIQDIYSLSKELEIKEETLLSLENELNTKKEELQRQEDKLRKTALKDLKYRINVLEDIAIEVEKVSRKTPEELSRVIKGTVMKILRDKSEYYGDRFLIRTGDPDLAFLGEEA